ncbi:MAG: sodium-dependent bicarbonate transport family permease [Sediminibacterium sp.]
MNLNLLFENLTNPALLFFILGIVSVLLKSDLAIPDNTSKFIALYLLFSIGFKGGQELSHESFGQALFIKLLFGFALSLCIPLYTFFILKKKFNIYDAAAIAAAYGSVSAVTFVTAVTYLELKGLHVSGHMVAIMALMEFPAIIISIVLMSIFDKQKEQNLGMLVKHALTNGSVILILGSLIIGLLANPLQAEGIRPFTTDIFKGFLSIFLLNMGIISGGKLKYLFNNGISPFLFAIFIPLLNGSIVAYLSHFLMTDISDQFIFSILAASASYIAVPAAMKIAAPKSNPGLFIPMALAITFPINLTIGMPLFYFIITNI